MDRCGQVAAPAAAALDCQVAGEGLGGGSAVVAEAVAHLEAARIKAQRLQRHAQYIAAHQRPEEIRLAVHNWQGYIEGVPRGGKHRTRGNAKALKAFLIGLVAPAKQVVEVHHPGGIGVPEADGVAAL